jgi:hypothetical protein
LVLDVSDIKISLLTLNLLPFLVSEVLVGECDTSKSILAKLVNYNVLINLFFSVVFAELNSFSILIELLVAA